METDEPIPPEIRAGVEANAVFDALRRGDFASAAAGKRDSEKWAGISVENSPSPNGGRR